jgi:hypothetical protein
MDMGAGGKERRVVTSRVVGFAAVRGTGRITFDYSAANTTHHRAKEPAAACHMWGQSWFGPSVRRTPRNQWKIGIVYGGRGLVLSTPMMPARPSENWSATCALFSHKRKQDRGSIFRRDYKAHRCHRCHGGARCDDPVGISPVAVGTVADCSEWPSW